MSRSSAYSQPGNRCIPGLPKVLHLRATGGKLAGIGAFQQLRIHIGKLKNQLHRLNRLGGLRPISSRKW